MSRIQDQPSLQSYAKLTTSVHNATTALLTAANELQQIGVGAHHAERAILALVRGCADKQYVNYLLLGAIKRELSNGNKIAVNPKLLPRE